MSSGGELNFLQPNTLNRQLGRMITEAEAPLLCNRKGKKKNWYENLINHVCLWLLNTLMYFHFNLWSSGVSKSLPYSLFPEVLNDVNSTDTKFWLRIPGVSKKNLF